MSCPAPTAIELEMVQKVVAEIPEISPVSVTEDEETIRIRVRSSDGARLSSVIFSREGLRRLEADPQRSTKIEYLRKDIARAAASRREYRYPRSLGSRF